MTWRQGKSKSAILEQYWKEINIMQRRMKAISKAEFDIGDEVLFEGKMYFVQDFVITFLGEKPILKYQIVPPNRQGTMPMSARKSINVGENQITKYKN